MKIMQTCVVVVGCLTLAIFSSQRIHAGEAEDAALELLMSAGVAQAIPQMGQSINQMLAPLIRKANPALDDESFKMVMDTMDEVFNERAPEILVAMIPVYTKHFSATELRDISAFYRTATGQKASRLMPQLFQEGITVGQHWGQQVMPEILQKLKERVNAKGIQLEL